MEFNMNKMNRDDKQADFDQIDMYAKELGVSGMGAPKSPGRIPYTEKQWIHFKERVQKTLGEKALDTDTIFNDSVARQYIVNYMEQEIVSEKADNERLLQNINIRLAHMTVSTPDGEKVYPVILHYRGHHLFELSYFYRNADNGIDMGKLEVTSSPIIIP